MFLFIINKLHAKEILIISLLPSKNTLYIYLYIEYIIYILFLLSFSFFFFIFFFMQYKKKGLEIE